MISPPEGEMLEDPEEYEQEEEPYNDLINDETGGEEVDESGEGQNLNQSDPEIQVGKPQVWIRIRPTPSFDNNVFEIGADEKILKLIVEPEDRLLQTKTGKTASFKFNTDGILQNVNQVQTFQFTVQDVVEKAMDGITGAIVVVGPEISGKSFTLFGPLTKYQFRGILPRALETIFDIVEAKKDQMEYRVILSMFEIRKNKIKDLLTLGAYELTRVGDYGPKGLFYEEITSIEQALGLILRGIAGQKLLPREAYAKYHTITYLDIIGRNLNDDKEGSEWRSRITFAKIASMPNRDKQKRYPLADPDPACPCSEGCYEDSKYKNIVVEDDEPTGKCCGAKLGKMAEDISIRKDMSFLEQMFIRSHDLRKINEYYQKLESLGMCMLMKPPKLAPSQYFRQSKLAHCLKDIVSGKTEIRILLHVRPERAYLQTTLEAMRFAQRARCVPHGRPKKMNSNGGQTFEQKIASMCEELGISDQLGKGPVELLSLNAQISPDKMREVLAQATAYFEEKLDSLEGSCKEQVKAMFEAFREMWTHMLEKDWAEGETRKSVPEPQEPIPEVPTEAVEATQTTEDNIILEEDFPPQSKRRSSLGKKKQKDKEGKSKGERSKKKKGRKSSTSKNKSADIQDNSGRIDLGSPLESQADVTAGTKLRESNDQGSHGNLIEGELEVDAEAEQSPQPHVSIAEPAKKKSSPSDLPKKSEELGATLPPVQPLTASPKSRPSVMKKRKKSTKPKPEGVPSEPAAVAPSNQPADGSGNPDQLQHEAWESFSKSSPLVEEFNQKQSLLRQCIVDHNETQKEVSNLLANLTKLQMDLDIMQQGRYSKGSELDGSGNSVVPTAEQAILQEIETSITSRDELVTRLKDLREQLQSQQRLVRESKMECESAFQRFCSEKYGKTVDTKNLPLSTLDDAVATTAQEALGFAPPEEPEGIIVTSGLNPDEREKFIAQHFDALKRIAKRQARALLKAYPQRPAWST